jgi:nucleotide-binding universal stress UspA family protein
MSPTDALLRLLLVGADGSDGSRNAVEWTALLAEETGAKVLAVHVLTYNHELLLDTTLETLRTWRRELAEELRTKWVAPLIDLGVDHQSRMIESDSPAAGLLDTAEREAADLVIVGAKGHGGFAGRILGSVSYAVSHRAARPVVVVPPDWEPA